MFFSSSCSMFWLLNIRLFFLTRCSRPAGTPSMAGGSAAKANAVMQRRLERQLTAKGSWGPEGRSRDGEQQQWGRFVWGAISSSLGVWQQHQGHWHFWRLFTLFDGFSRHWVQQGLKTACQMAGIKQGCFYCYRKINADNKKINISYI